MPIGQLSVYSATPLRMQADSPKVRLTPCSAREKLYFEDSSSSSDESISVPPTPVRRETFSDMDNLEIPEEDDDRSEPQIEKKLKKFNFERAKQLEFKWV